LVETLTGQQLTSPQCVKIAEALSEANLREDAAGFASRALAGPVVDAWRLQSAAKAYAEGAHISAVGLWAILPATVAGDVIASVAQGLAEAGNTDLAVAFARAALTHPNAEGYEMGNAAVAWLAAAGESAMPTVRESIEQILATRPTPAKSNLAYRLATAGHREMAINYARERLTSADRREWELSNSVEAWLQAAGTSASAEIDDAVRSIRPLSAMELALIAEGAALGGSMALAEQLATEALTAGAATTWRFGSVARALSYALGPLAGKPLHDALTAQRFSGVDWISVSDHLCASGAVEAAQRIWTDILNHPQAGIEHVAVAAARLVQTSADTAVAGALRDAQPERTTALTNLIAAIGDRS
jgi:hypothetical protein